MRCRRADGPVPLRQLAAKSPRTLDLGMRSAVTQIASSGCWVVCLNADAICVAFNAAIDRSGAVVAYANGEGEEIQAMKIIDGRRKGSTTPCSLCTASTSLQSCRRYLRENKGRLARKRQRLGWTIDGV